MGITKTLFIILLPILLLSQVDTVSFEQIKIIPAQRPDIGSPRLIHSGITPINNTVSVWRLQVGYLPRHPVGFCVTVFYSGATVTAWERVVPNPFELCVFKCYS